ncbi:MAG: hypothetical protein WAK18_15780 [Nocardioidaceae bacterium]
MSSSRFSLELRSGHVPRSVVDLRRAGITRGMADGPNWRRTSRGFYAPAASGPLSPTQRILDAVPLVPPRGAISGWAAAYGSGVDDLDGLDARRMRPLPVVIVSPDDLGRRSPPGIAYVRAPLSLAERRPRCGIPLVCAPRAVFDAARMQSDLVECVAVVDAASHQGVVELNHLREYVDQHAGWTGVPRVRRALGLADCATRSTWESRLRVFAMLTARLPRRWSTYPCSRSPAHSSASSTCWSRKQGW